MTRRGSIDYLTLSLVLVLVLVGIVALASASSDLAKVKLDDTSYYLSHQLIYGLGLGTVGFLFGMFFPYKKYKKAAPILLVLGIGILLLTFTPLGFTAGGATRWISLGFMTVQPAELMKIALVIYLAALFSGEKSKRHLDLRQGFMPFLVVCGLVSGMLFAQRSTSSVFIIMSAAVAIYFVSGAKKKYLFYALGLAAIAFSVLIMSSPYRLERFKTYFDPSADTSGSGYQLRQALITIGSGGVWGVGFGNSISKKYLPEQIGDSIFAIIAAEFGFVGATALILIFLVLVLRTYLAAKHLNDPFGKLILVGFGTLIGTQAFMHIAAISGIIPLTGVPLPFISYGGTALIAFMAMSGIMLNITRSPA